MASVPDRVLCDHSVLDLTIWLDSSVHNQRGVLLVRDEVLAG